MKFKEALEKTVNATKKEVEDNSGMVGAISGAVIGSFVIPVIGTAIGAWIGYKVDKRLR
jgi:uncharacterized protein YqgC (DUF456 family)